jgi:hypothetical protein
MRGLFQNQKKAPRLKALTAMAHNKAITSVHPKAKGTGSRTSASAARCLLMLLALNPHPQSFPQAARGVEVEVSRSSTCQLTLRYLVAGAIGDLCLPPVAAPTRHDGLWQHTCFEAFIRTAPDGSYYEFNFSPSTQWAAYRFGTYRSGRSPARLARAPIRTRIGEDRFELRTLLDLGPLADLDADPVWQLGLSAVVEERSGHKSYWALTHPDGDPDFHHSDCFALELAAAEHS